MPHNILLTGANGYIGQRLIPVLLELGHHLYCCVRDKERFEDEHNHPNIKTIEVDFLDENSLVVFPKDIDAAYFLIHSMSSSGDFEAKELASAVNFLNLIEQTNCKQIIYLTGIVNESHLSKHFVFSHFGVIIIGSFSTRSLIISKDALPEPTIIPARKAVSGILLSFNLFSTARRECKCFDRCVSFTIPVK